MGRYSALVKHSARPIVKPVVKPIVATAVLLLGLTAFGAAQQAQAQVFSRIRIGDADGFGFPSTEKLRRPLQGVGPGPADTNGDVILGPMDETSRPLDAAFANGVAYLAVEVGDSAPIQPRLQILSSTFVLNASQLRGADLPTSSILTLFVTNI